MSSVLSVWFCIRLRSDDDQSKCRAKKCHETKVQFVSGTEYNSPADCKPGWLTFSRFSPPPPHSPPWRQFLIRFPVRHPAISSVAQHLGPGVTTMLNFFTTSNGFRSTLPVVSNLTAMNVWDGVCMCFIYASLLEFVCVNYVGRKRPLHNVVYRPGENPVTQVRLTELPN